MAGSMSQANLEQHIQDIEIENSNLASLYVALSQLHSSLEVSEVLGVIVEIMLNFVGAETFAVLVSDEDETLRAIAAHGVAVGDVPPVANEGVFAAARVSGEPQISALSSQDRGRTVAAPPVVCIPLHAAGEVIGALALWTFLPQKQSFTAIDHEIIQLMSKSAGTALEAARLAMTAPPSPGDRGYYEAFASLLR
jgi:nitrate/nitrite-specific signal transduction histidine kinase